MTTTKRDRPEFGDEYLLVAVKTDRMDSVRTLLGTEDEGSDLLIINVPAWCPCDHVHEAAYVQTSLDGEHQFACLGCAKEMKTEFDGQLFG